MATLRVNITQRDIDHGLRRCADSCAVALALFRYFGGKEQVAWVAMSAEYGTIGFTDGIQLNLTNNPAARDFISAFDDGQSVQPTTLTFREEA